MVYLKTKSEDGFENKFGQPYAGIELPRIKKIKSYKSVYVQYLEVYTTTRAILRILYNNIFVITSSAAT